MRARLKKRKQNSAQKPCQTYNLDKGHCTLTWEILLQGHRSSTDICLATVCPPALDGCQPCRLLVLLVKDYSFKIV